MAANEQHDLQDQIWEQQRGENDRWYQRFSQYLALGATRSVRAVYNAEKSNECSHAVPASWTKATRQFDWKSRAHDYDAWQRRLLFAHGNASETEQVTKLDDLAQKLYDRSVLMFTVAPAEEKFNDKLIAQLLAVFDALAKRTGSLAPQRHEVTGKHGNAIEVHEEQETTMRVVFYLPEIAHLEELDSTELLSGDDEPKQLEGGTP